MTSLDWIVVAAYGALLLGVGLWQKRKASGGVDDYFVSGRKLRWWVAGTSMIAASFASDTPLLVSGLVRSKGIWGNWQWWGLGISTVFTVFFFARLWRRSEVLTEAELTELRYSGRAAAGLRGFKAVFWGLLYNCFATGAWGIVGLVTVTTVMTGVDRTTAILVCAALGGTYAIVSGFWGVVTTDFLQFVLALGGAVLLALYSLGAAGGLGAVVAAVPPDKLQLLPLEGEGLTFCLTFLLVQWWAWKNTDGGGVLVQRMAACRDGREAVYATLWYNVVHYAVRCWPWVLVALASMVVIPDSVLPVLKSGKPDYQSAYPLMIKQVLPAGLRGLVVAWFFAEFVASVAGSMNWGSSLLVNDGYRRFVRPDADERSLVKVSRWAGALVLAGSVGTAFLAGDIVQSFGWVLKGTAAVGVVFAARWLWWRVNAWSEMTAMVASPVATFVIEWIPRNYKGVVWGEMEKLLLILASSLVPVAIATFATRADDDATLERFYRKVRPPGPGWARIAARCPDAVPDVPMGRILVLWIAGVSSVYALMGGIGSVLLLRPAGWSGIAAGLALLAFVVGRVRRWEAA